MSHHSVPLPSALDGRDWEIRDSGDPTKAYVDFQKMEMVVPFGDSAREEFVRAHESMHVAITPRGTGLGKDRTIQAVEDARVNSALASAGIDISAHTWTDEEFRSLVTNPKYSPLEAARCLAALRGSGSEDLMRKIVRETFPAVESIVDEVMREHFTPHESAGKIVPWSATKAAAEAIKARVEEVEREEASSPDSGDERGEDSAEEKSPDASSAAGSDSEDAGESESPPPSGSEGSGGEGEGDSPDSEGEGQSETGKPFKPLGTPEVEKLPHMTPQEAKAIKDAGIDPTAERSEPGKMVIERPELDAVFLRKKDTGKRNDEVGAIPRQLHRVTIDNRVFQRRLLKDEGAAVLIDVSGSMSLSNDNLEYVLTEVPSAIVAIYSGNGARGKLRIIAEGKRRMSGHFKSGMGGGNIVDLEALKWLASRREKRKLWVCDTIITGVGDRFMAPKYVRQAAQIVTDAKIVQLHDIGWLAAYLRTGQKVKPTDADYQAVNRSRKS